MDGSSGSDNIRVNLIFAAKNIKSVLGDLKQVQNSIVNISKSAAQMSRVGGTTTSLSRQTQDYRLLAQSASRARKETMAYSKATVFGIDKAGKSTAQLRKEFKEFSKEQYKAGTAIVGKPQSLSMVKRNFEALSKNTKDVRLSGIATINTMRTLEDGVARVGGRGFTAMERFRLRSFALRKDLSALGSKIMDTGKQTAWLGRSMMMNLTLPLAAFAAAASREFLKVQNQFFQLQKVLEFKDTGTGQREELAEKFSGLRKEIIALSEDLGQSQAVITGVFRDVAALGLEDEALITGWSKGIAEIAAIGDIDLSVATEFFRTTNALFTTGNQTDKLTKTNELMAQFNAIADETSLQLKDLADAFPEVAPVMQKMGFEAAEIGASLAGAYKAGIPATEMAHALKFGFQRVVGPTKDASKAIEGLGINFFDAAGQVGGIGQARSSLLQMASALQSLRPQDYGDILGDIVGNRQTARWGSFLNSVYLGERQLARAMADRKVTTEELREIDSDYMRGLLASGKIQSDHNKLVEAGLAEAVDFEAIDDPGKRFKLAMDMYREDPATQWNIMITTMKNALIQFGEIIVPIISNWGQKLADAAKWFASLPPAIIKVAAAATTLAGAIGGLIVGFGVLQSLGGAGLKVVSKMVPKFGIRDIMPDQALELLNANPQRQDIFRSGNRFVRSKYGAPSTKFTPLVGSDAAAIMQKAQQDMAPIAQRAQAKEALTKAENQLRAAKSTAKLDPNMVRASAEYANMANKASAAQKVLDDNVAHAKSNLKNITNIHDQKIQSLQNELAKTTATTNESLKRKRFMARMEEGHERRRLKNAEGALKKAKRNLHQAEIDKIYAGRKTEKFNKEYDKKLQARNNRLLASQKRFRKAEAELYKSPEYTALQRGLERQKRGQFGGDAATIQRLKDDVLKSRLSTNFLAAGDEVARRRASIKALEQEKVFENSRTKRANKEIARQRKIAERAAKDVEKHTKNLEKASAKRILADNAYAKRTTLNRDNMTRKELQYLAASEAAAKKREQAIIKAEAKIVAAESAANANRIAAANKLAQAQVNLRNIAATSAAANSAQVVAAERAVNIATRNLAVANTAVGSMAATAAGEAILRGSRRAAKSAQKEIKTIEKAEEKAEKRRVKAEEKQAKARARREVFAGRGVKRSIVGPGIYNVARLEAASRPMRMGMHIASFLSLKKAGSTAFLAIKESAARATETLKSQAQVLRANRKEHLDAASRQKFTARMQKSPESRKDYLGRAKASRKKARMEVLTGEGGIFKTMKQMPMMMAPATLAMGKFLAIIMAIVVSIGLLFMTFRTLFKVIKDDWDKINRAIKPAMDAFSLAFEEFKNALATLGDAFMNSFIGTLFGEGALGGKKALEESNMWQVVASIITTALSVLTKVIQAISTVIKAIAPYFSWLGTLVASAAGFWVKVFKKDFPGALLYLLKYFAAFVRPVTWIIEKIIEAFVGMLQGIIAIFREVGKVIGWVAERFGFDGAVEGAENFFNTIQSSLTDFRNLDMAGGLERKIDEWLQGRKFNIELSPNGSVLEYKNEGRFIGEAAGTESADAFNDEMGDKAGKGVGEDIAKNILAEFLGVLKPKVRAQMDELRAEIEKSFTDASNARLKVFDDRISAIEAVEKAEEELLRTEEYIENKRELLNKKALDLENYRRNRALAIYEGRVGDVRTLDLEYTVSKKDNEKEIANLEQERQRYLLGKSREAAKDKINIEKLAEEERLRIAEEAFKKQLDIIMEYEPRTVGEFDFMISKLKKLAGEFGVAWPAAGRDGSYYFLEAIRQSNDEIIQTFGWGGEAAVMSWVNNFIDEFARGILMMKQEVTNGISDLNDTANNALSGFGSGMPTDPMEDSLDAVLAAGPDHPRWNEAAQMYSELYSGIGRQRPETTRQRLERLPTTAARAAENARIAFESNKERGWLGSIRNSLKEIPLITNEIAIGLAQGLNSSDTRRKIEDALNRTINTSIIEKSKNVLLISSPSQVFYNIGTEVVRGLLKGVENKLMWVFVEKAIKDNIEKIALNFSTIGGKVVEKLGPLGSQLSLWFTIELSLAGAAVNNSIEQLLIKFIGFAAKVIDRLGSFGAQMSLWFVREMTQAGRAITTGIQGWISRFTAVTPKIIQAIGPLGFQLTQTFQKALNSVNSLLPTLINLILSNFNGFPIRVIDKMRGLGGIISGFLAAEMSFVRMTAKMQIDLVAFEFSSFGQRIVNAITGSVNSASGDFSQLGKTMFNSLLKFINEKIIKTLRDFTIPFPVAEIGGQRPFAGLRDLIPLYHTGGVVTSQKAGSGMEVMAKLQSGEGVLPISAMKKIGRPAFELLRQGKLGEAVAMAAAGGVSVRMPRVSSVKMPERSEAAAKMQSGDVYVHVDTFIGQEQWFKEMANKYDMKVSARAAKNNGSQRRIISSYNQNERNTYR